MLAMMEFWIRDIGIDGFQCRSADMVPVDFWEIARNELDNIKPVILISESRLPKHLLHAFDLGTSGIWKELCSTSSMVSASASVIYDSLQAEAGLFSEGSLHVRFYAQDGDNNDFILPQARKEKPRFYCSACQASRLYSATIRKGITKNSSMIFLRNVLPCGENIRHCGMQAFVIFQIQTRLKSFRLFVIQEMIPS